jgi:hypothetical protein
VNQGNSFDSLCSVRYVYHLVPIVSLAVQFGVVVDCHGPKRKDKSMTLMFNMNLFIYIFSPT